MREEGLLKLFFADALPREEAVETLRRDARPPARLADAAARRWSREALEQDDPFPLMVLRGGIEFNRVVRRLVRADGGAAPRRRPREKEQLMFDALARLADGNARRVGLLAIVFFVLAGALGGSVASRLDPYGADDPATETVEGEGTAAGRRAAGPGGGRRGRERAGRQAVHAGPGSRRWSAACAAAPTSPRSPATTTPTPPPSSPATADSTYFAVALKPTDDKQVQEAGADIADQLSGHAGVVVGGFAVAQEQVNKQVEKDLRMAEMLAFPLLFLLSLLFFRSLVASVLPLMIGGLAIVGTFLILRVASEFGSISIFALNLTTALGLGPGDRLQPLHRLPLPRGDRQGRARAWRRCGGCWRPPGARSSSPR